jgi:hypothetical protein
MRSVVTMSWDVRGVRITRVVEYVMAFPVNFFAGITAIAEYARRTVDSTPREIGQGPRRPWRDGRSLGTFRLTAGSHAPA